MIARTKRPAHVVLPLLLAWLGQTISAKYVNDLFILLEGVHRIHSSKTACRSGASNTWKESAKMGGLRLGFQDSNPGSSTCSVSG